MSKGLIYVVGIGPGSMEGMTMSAQLALEKSEVIVGYTVYVDLVKAAWPQKEYRTTPMRKEVDRCELALSLAAEGKTVAMVCSGDAGVYGMSGLILQLSEKYPEVEVKVIPGVTAALSGAAVLGAPLTHDFCVISLSDHLTAWETICLRLRAAAQADFAIALYNPSSKLRSDYLEKACDILLEYKSPDTVCGLVENIDREGERSSILTLRELRDTKVDMFTTVFIGNAETRKLGERMVTPRGYRNV